MARLFGTDGVRERVGSTFWARLGPLMESQIRSASAIASSWVSSAYLAK